jgi:long-chain acyl-CoA synthetase
MNFEPTRFYRDNLLCLFNTSSNILFHNLIDNASISYEQARSVIHKFSQKLSEYGIQEGDRVAVVMNNSPELFMIYLTCLLKRIVVCPVNPDYSVEDIRFCLSLCKAKIVIGNRKLHDLDIPIAEEEIFKIDVPNLENNCEKLTRSAYQADDIFTITFTSGSTGNPKGIAHKSEVFFANAHAFNNQTGLGQEQCMYHVMPMFYMAGILNTIICPLEAGGKVVIDKSFGALSPFTFWKNFIESGCTCVWLSPTMIKSIIKLDRDLESSTLIQQNPERFRIFSGTAPLTIQTKNKFFEKYNFPLQQSYGLSETLIVSVKEKTEPPFNGSVGKLVGSTKVNFLEDSEIVLVTDYLMAGYIDKPGSIKMESGHQFFTGDLGKVDKGELYITGRKKELIIKGGENINPLQIENVILRHNSVKIVAVIGFEDEFYGEEIAAFIQSYGTDFEEIEKEIRNICIHELKPSFIPKVIKFVDEMPLTPTGKVQKRKLSL